MIAFHSIVKCETETKLSMYKSHFRYSYMGDTIYSIPTRAEFQGFETTNNTLV